MTLMSAPTLLLNIQSYCKLSITDNHIYGVMVSVLTSSAVHRGFETRSGQTKDYKIWICCFSTKDRLVQNQNNVSEWSNMSTSGLLFQWASTIKIQISMLV
jgi:hypothetical protein